MDALQLVELPLPVHDTRPLTSSQLRYNYSQWLKIQRLLRLSSFLHKKTGAILTILTTVGRFRRPRGPYAHIIISNALSHLWGLLHQPRKSMLYTRNAYTRFLTAHALLLGRLQQYKHFRPPIHVCHPHPILPHPTRPHPTLQGILNPPI